MKANESNLNKFLSQNDTQFVIPVYQRNYDWNQNQCKQLVDDILSLGSSGTKAHFIGSIVFIHDGVYTSSEISELNIIDGQQRLTTITLIYIVLYQILVELGKEKLVEKINETYLINKFAPEEEKLKLRPTDNNDKALQYLLKGDFSDEFPNYSRVIDNYNYFKSRISIDNYESVIDGLSKLMFVEISLDKDKDDPQRIFESLNSTGLELSQADLIRNYILMDLGRKAQNKIYHNYWEKIEEYAKDKHTNASRISDFIRDYLTLENKKIPNKKKVYLEFKNKYPATSVDELEMILNSVKKYAIYYNKLINPEKEKDNEIRQQLLYINKLEINVAYPFILKVYNDYKEEVIVKEIFIKVLELIQSFTWRRFIIGLPTNALNKIFMRLYDDVKTNDYLDSISASLLKKKGTQRFPRNAEVLQALKERDMYNIKSKNRTYFLERLENYNNKETVNIDDNAAITVEHIFPQNPEQRWKESLKSEDYTAFKESHLNTIANLTLSGNNGKLGNKVFLDKKNMNKDGGEQGYIYSRLWLNRYLREIDKWDLETLDKRFELISNRVIQIWSIPDIEFKENDNSEINIFDAEDPTGKRLEYAIFLDEKKEYKEVTRLYLDVIKTLFEVQPESFFTSDLQEKLNLTKSAEVCRDPGKISDTYFIELKMDSKSKFQRMKKVLSFLDLEDELFVKYKDE